MEGVLGTCDIVKSEAEPRHRSVPMHIVGEPRNRQR